MNIGASNPSSKKIESRYTVEEDESEDSFYSDSDCEDIEDDKIMTTNGEEADQQEDREMATTTTSDLD